MGEVNKAHELFADGLLTVKESAHFTKLSTATLYKLMASGDLSYTKIGRSRRIPRKALVELAVKNLVGGREG